MLKLSDIRTKLKFNKNTGLSVFAISDLVNHPEEYKIDFDVYLPTKGKNLQRPLVWTLLQKQEIILSLLKGITIPSMAIIQHTINDSHNRRDRTYEIIDGKQRLSSIISFAKGEFPINVKGQDYYINDLDPEAKRTITNHWVTADVGYSYTYSDGSLEAFITDDEKIAWFEMINFAGTPQDIEHLNNLKS
jgi:hypothetical protein